MKYRITGIALLLVSFVLVGGIARADSHGGDDADSKKITEYMDDHIKVKVGAGLKSSVRTAANAAPDGHTASKNFTLDNARIYLSGKALDFVGFELNSEIATGEPGGEDIDLLDGVVKLEFNDLFNVWGGRFLPPSDRSNLDGPFYLNAYDFPFVQAYPARFAGRDTGVAVWGQLNGGMFKWQGGAFEGTNGVVNDEDDPLFAGRLVLNLLDPEPGYYNASTYYGEKEVFAIGVSGMHQENSSGTLDAGGDVIDSNDFSGLNVDVLFEKTIGEDIINNSLLTGGVLSLEGSYWLYDDDDLDDDVAAATTVVGNANRQGSSFFLLASYLLPNEVSFGVMKGRFQPYARHQRYNRDSDTGIESSVDAGVNYIIDGHNAKLSLFYQNVHSNHLDGNHAETTHSGVLAGQFQF